MAKGGLVVLKEDLDGVERMTYDDLANSHTKSS